MTMCHRRPSGLERGPSGLTERRSHSYSQVTDRSALCRGSSSSPLGAPLDNPMNHRLPSLPTTLQSRTQGIAHHEKALGFVVVWSQIGGGHHIGGVPPLG
jgi:hypothetical protein